MTTNDFFNYLTTVNTKILISWTLNLLLLVRGVSPMSQIILLLIKFVVHIVRSHRSPSGDY